MAHLVQIGKDFHYQTVGLLEALRTFRFFSASSAPHFKPRHDTFPRCEDYQRYCYRTSGRIAQIKFAGEKNLDLNQECPCTVVMKEHALARTF